MELFLSTNVCVYTMNEAAKDVHKDVHEGNFMWNHLFPAMEVLPNHACFRPWYVPLGFCTGCGIWTGVYHVFCTLNVERAVRNIASENRRETNSLGRRASKGSLNLDNVDLVEHHVVLSFGLCCLKFFSVLALVPFHSGIGWCFIVRTSCNGRSGVVIVLRLGSCCSTLYNRGCSLFSGWKEACRPYPTCTRV